MKRERTNKRVKVGLIAAAAVAAIAVPVYAFTLFVWVHPCEDPADLTCDLGQINCRCEADWEDSANWNQPGYPDDAGDRAKILHSNPQWPGEPLVIEGYLLIHLASSFDLDGLEIVTDSTAGDDTLDVRLDSPVGESTKTLTPGFVSVDGTNGPAELQLLGKVAIQTDPND